MNDRSFRIIVNARVSAIRNTLTVKGAEYTVDKNNRFHNFERAGRLQGISRERALLGMSAKHTISIHDIVDNLDKCIPPYSVIEEKIGDAINYLILLEGMLKENVKHQNFLGGIANDASNQNNTLQS